MLEKKLLSKNKNSKKNAGKKTQSYQWIQSKEKLINCVYVLPRSECTPEVQMHSGICQHEKNIRH